MTSIPPLRLERLYKSPPDRVFEAWTDREVFTRWFGPKGMTVSECELDARPGGSWRAVLSGGDMERDPEVSGVFSEVTAPRRLVFTWAWTQDDGTRGHDYTITIDVEPAGTGSRLTLTQDQFVEAEQRAKHEFGWTSSFDCLDEELRAAVA